MIGRVLKSERGSLKRKVRGRRDYKRMIKEMQKKKKSYVPGKPMEMNSLRASKKEFSPMNSN